ncbi:11931_t:CDS:2 [Funneliformis geosporum]|uniref:16818_t:CDS:1 n=1 Tax=Funneliformis geosporum TaxID=1117311 RepID=A0A9W4SUT2_9GLOM|nr:11931_t:CDS:2 [Funneliformis geosporum]CAI2182126.1 16818_t:CDS:2 [Funneliformis geosporum]
MEKLRKEYNANQQFEQNYPKTTRNQVTELNISNKNLEGELDLSDFINLEKLDCAFNKLTKLNLKGLKNLWHIDAGLNMIEDLDSIIDSLDSEKLLVLKVHNNNLPEQDLSKFERFVKLETLLVGKYNRFYGSLESLKNMSNLKELGIYGTDINSGLEFLPESVEELLTDIKNILVIGRSGRGKSTLANVITGEENKFAESSGSVSKTKKIQSKHFTDENNDYLVIDTPGIGDTRMSDNEVLDVIGEAVYLVKDGLDQVLFVVDGRFDKYEMATYNLLRTIIFDEKITNHTTVVRTNFADFRNKESRENDINSMKEITQEKKADEKYKKVTVEIEKLNKELKSTLSEIIESCKSRVIHVDNPPSNKKLREKSRRRILDQLQKTCQTTSYKPDKLKELSDEISDDMDKLLQSRKELESEMKKLRSSSVSSLTNGPLLKTTTNITKPVASSENATAIPLEIPEFTTESHDTTIAIGKIKELEDKKAKLRKEIAKRERIIRQKVLKHIYKNYQEISSELGGDILMQSVVGEHN